MKNTEGRFKMKGLIDILPRMFGTVFASYNLGYMRRLEKPFGIAFFGSAMIFLTSFFLSQKLLRALRGRRS